KKIKPEVFNYLSSVIIDNYYVQSNENIKRFKDFRVLVDISVRFVPVISVGPCHPFRSICATISV
ncbi:hypothetical protein, partial [Flavobacterium azizsancarii]|uniref:hypothetical protein n=1 Tax=Flavobacterium azizsancarii TaxID=2961580 RepID=UPI002300CE9E